MGVQKKSGRCRGAGRLAAACGARLVAGIQVVPLSSASPVSDWGARVLEPAKSIQDAIAAAKTSGEAGNVHGVKAACRQIQDSANDVKAILPAPTADLTDEVTAALSELRMGVRPCLDLGPTDRPGGRSVTPDMNAIKTAEAHLEKAVAHMRAAESMILAG